MRLWNFYNTGFCNHALSHLAVELPSGIPDENTISRRLPHKKHLLQSVNHINLIFVNCAC
jgi:hypothetical protein